MQVTKTAVVLLSGGIDSSTTLAIAKNLGFSIFALTFNYGQTHQAELQSAKKLAEQIGVARHLIFKLDLADLVSSALTGDSEIPKMRTIKNISSEIPTTYVPGRNLVFLSIALSWAETIGSYDIFIGANSIDYSGYPDCRPEFIKTFQKCANLATKAGVEGKNLTIHAPLISMSKGEIIKKGIELGVDYSLSHSCYDPDSLGRACGVCDSCMLRMKGFQEAGVEDPIDYIT